MYLASRIHRSISSTRRAFSSRPLDGVRVLDLSRILAGPYATMLFGDLGASVTKVENAKWGDDTRRWAPPYVDSGYNYADATSSADSEDLDSGLSAYFTSVNRNKRSLAVDLKTSAGQTVVQSLAKEADVIVENFLPGTLQKWGLDYATVAVENPSVVYASLTGYGQNGPDARNPAYDVMVCAEGGMMGVTGTVDECVKPGVAITDITSGLHLYGSVLAALYDRQRTGLGTYIDVSLLASQLSALTNLTQNFLSNADPKYATPQRWGTAHQSIVPYQAFTCKDGASIVVGALNDSQWQALCTELGAADLLQDEALATNPLRVKHRVRLLAALQEIFDSDSASHWLQLLRGHVPVAPVNSIEEAVHHPTIKHREMVSRVDFSHAQGYTHVMGHPVDFYTRQDHSCEGTDHVESDAVSDTHMYWSDNGSARYPNDTLTEALCSKATTVTNHDAAAPSSSEPAVDELSKMCMSYTAPPRLGEHTRQVLEELGYDEESIRALHASGAVRSWER